MVATFCSRAKSANTGSTWEGKRPSNDERQSNRQEQQRYRVQGSQAADLLRDTASRSGASRARAST